MKSLERLAQEIATLEKQLNCSIDYLTIKQLENQIILLFEQVEQIIAEQENISYYDFESLIRKYLK